MAFYSRGVAIVNRRTAIRTLITVVVVSLAAVTVTARELRVPEDFPTIQDAVNVAQANDVILISPGLYSGFTVVGKSDLTIVGDVDKPELVVISGTVLIKDGTNITLSGLTVTGDGNGVEVDGEIQHFTVQRCWLIRNELSGIVFLPTAVYEDVKILKCRVLYNGHDGIVLGGKGKKVFLRGNNISYNGRTTPTGCGIRVSQKLEDTVISNNIIVGNPFAGIHPQ